MAILRIEVKVDGKLVEVHEFDTMENNLTRFGRFWAFINKFKEGIGKWSFDHFFPEHE